MPHMTESSHLPVADFAHLVGKSERTIRRYVESGKLECVETIQGMRIPRSELIKFEYELDIAGHVPAQVAGHSSTVPDTQAASAGQEPAMQGDAGQVPVRLYELALETLRKAVEQNAALQLSKIEPPAPATPEADVQPESPAAGTVPLEAHLAALQMAERQMERIQTQFDNERRRADQAERAKLALEFQLQQYQSALSEQAESLAELQALRKAAELKLEELERVEPEIQQPALPLESLKTGTARKTWSQRLRGIFGLSQAQ